MREIRLRIERNGAMFDLQIKTEDGEDVMTVTGEGMERIVKAALAHAINSLD